MSVDDFLSVSISSKAAWVSTLSLKQWFGHHNLRAVALPCACWNTDNARRGSYG